MNAHEYAFMVLAFVGGVSAIAVVTSTNVVHAALYLVVALLSVAGTYLLLGAEFVAWVQVMIYVGAIVILFLFGLMLTKAPIGRDALDSKQRWLGGLIAAGVFAGLVFLIQDAFPVRDGAVRAGSSSVTADVGHAIFRDFVLPFEAVSFVLLAALIGAIVLARKEEGPS